METYTLDDEDTIEILKYYEKLNCFVYDQRVVELVFRYLKEDFYYDFQRIVLIYVCLKFFTAISTYVTLDSLYKHVCSFILGDTELKGKLTSRELAVGICNLFDYRSEFTEIIAKKLEDKTYTLETYVEVCAQLDQLLDICEQQKVKDAKFKKQWEKQQR